MNLQDWLQKEFYTSVAQAPVARTWFQNLYWAIEAYGEVPQIENLVGQIGDEWIERNLVRHLQDEARHARLWQELLTKRGKFYPQQLPDWANLIAAFDQGGWLHALDKLPSQQTIPAEELIPFFAALHVLETDGVERFNTFAEAAEPVDPEAAQTLHSIIKDEKFHVYYTREAVERLSLKIGRPDYGNECIHAAQKAHLQWIAASSPRFVETLEDRGARFSWPFKTVSKLLNWIGVLSGRIPKTNKIPAPPPMRSISKNFQPS